jgi:telomerase reverse transcriptase
MLIYLGVTGTYLSELEPIDIETSVCRDRKPETTVAVFKKPPSTAKTSKRTVGILHKPNSVVFVRRRMLYARPAINSKGGVRFGLRHIRGWLSLIFCICEELNGYFSRRP